MYRVYRCVCVSVLCIYYILDVILTYKLQHIRMNFSLIIYILNALCTLFIIFLVVCTNFIGYYYNYLIRYLINSNHFKVDFNLFGSLSYFYVILVATAINNII